MREAPEPALAIRCRFEASWFSRPRLPITIKVWGIGPNMGGSFFEFRPQSSLGLGHGIPKLADLKPIKWQDVVPRVLVDFAIIHCSMLIAFAISVIYQTRIAGPAPAADLLQGFRSYYLSTFLLLSPLFPVFFYLIGIYTYVRP